MRRFTGTTLLSGLLCLFLSGYAAAQGAGRSYQVDPAASDVHWLIFKAGTLQRLGHNHVISVAEPKGVVTVADDLSKSTFELTIPVADLVVDNPMLRAGLGADFSSVPTADDIAGTRKNMLGERVLKGDEFPSIKITGVGPSGASGSQTFAVTVEILGRSVPLTLPGKVTIGDGVIEASGQFDLNHADLGMQPFTVMLGALQVAENMSFSYRIVARHAGSH